MCLEPKPDSMLVPCEHTCVCKECAGKCMSGDKLCPICRTPISDVLLDDFSGVRTNVQGGDKYVDGSLHLIHKLDRIYGSDKLDGSNMVEWHQFSVTTQTTFEKGRDKVLLFRRVSLLSSLSDRQAAAAFLHSNKQIENRFKDQTHKFQLVRKGFCMLLNAARLAPTKTEWIEESKCEISIRLVAYLDMPKSEFNSKQQRLLESSMELVAADSIPNVMMVAIVNKVESLSANGLHWKSAGTEKPKQGHEIRSVALQDALTRKTEFTRKEWDVFGIRHLSLHTFVKARNGEYFQPAVKIAEANSDKHAAEAGSIKVSVTIAVEESGATQALNDAFDFAEESSFTESGRCLCAKTLSEVNAKLLQMGLSPATLVEEGSETQKPFGKQIDTEKSLEKKLAKKRENEKKASGLKWLKCNEPIYGRLLSNVELQKALERKDEALENALKRKGTKRRVTKGNLKLVYSEKLPDSTFTEKEWSNFGITDLCMGHFVRSGDCYFQPAEEDKDAASGLKWLKLGKTEPGLGLKWEELGATKPSQGRELKNDELAKALLLAKAAMGRDPVVTSFSQQEWDSFRIKELRHDSFVKSGNSYFRPTKTTNNWILQNSGLAEALTRKTEFTQQEWDAFGIKDLRMIHVVKSDECYFKPAKTLNRQSGFPTSTLAICTANLLLSGCATKYQAERRNCKPEQDKLKAEMKQTTKYYKHLSAWEQERLARQVLN